MIYVKESVSIFVYEYNVFLLLDVFRTYATPQTYKYIQTYSYKCSPTQIPECIIINYTTESQIIYCYQKSEKWEACEYKKLKVMLWKSSRCTNTVYKRYNKIQHWNHNIQIRKYLCIFESFGIIQLYLFAVSFSET